jgi:hypothetical protein
MPPLPCFKSAGVNTPAHSKGIEWLIPQAPNASSTVHEARGTARGRTTPRYRGIPDGGSRRRRQTRRIEQHLLDHAATERLRTPEQMFSAAGISNGY